MSDETYEIQNVITDVLKAVIDTRKPSGLFLAREGERWCAVDNTTGDAWTEDFPTKKLAESWLRGEFEISEYLEGEYPPYPERDRERIELAQYLQDECKARGWTLAEVDGDTAYITVPLFYNAVISLDSKEGIDADFVNIACNINNRPKHIP